MTVHVLHRSPIGPLLLVGEPRRDGIVLTGLYMDGHLRGPATPPGTPEGAAFAAVARELDAYFAGDLRAFDLVLAPAGSPFQRRVWEALRRIPFGATTTYGELAVRIGRPGSARAVGSAVARNPISIVVPCHRVVGADGNLTGYAGGVERKRFLLALEGAAAQGGRGGARRPAPGP